MAAPGTVEFAKRWQPLVGDIVSFKYRGLLLGTKIPKLPIVYRIRTDLTWDDVIRNWKELKPRISGTPQVTAHNGFSFCHPLAYPLRRSKTKHRSKGHWASLDNRKKFFCELATELGFDPLNSEGWKQVTYSHIRAKNVRNPLNSAEC